MSVSGAGGVHRASATFAPHTAVAALKLIVYLHSDDNLQWRKSLDCMEFCVFDE